MLGKSRMAKGQINMKTLSNPRNVILSATQQETRKQTKDDKGMFRLFWAEVGYKTLKITSLKSSVVSQITLRVMQSA